MNNQIYDEKDKEKYHFAKDSFELVQVDKKIHDTKFDTKPTTFARDAFKRFCKNKSSVVGAIIIGLLLLCAIILPIAIPYNIDEPDPNQSLLRPKLFDAGTGWWDGTTAYDNVLVDPKTNGPANFNPKAVVPGTLKITDEQFFYAPNENAKGGSLHLIANGKASSAEYAETESVENYHPFIINANDNYVLNMEFSNETNNEHIDAGHALAEYRVVVMLGSKEIVVRDYSKNFEPLSVNLSDLARQNFVTDDIKCRVVIDFKQQTDKLSYLLINKIEVKSDNTDPAVVKALADNSMLDANYAAELMPEDNIYPIGYWRTTAQRTVYKAIVRHCSFRYDKYYEVFNERDFKIGKSVVEEYVENGWCDYDFNIGPSSFKVLDAEKCPIISVVDQTTSTIFVDKIDENGNVVINPETGKPEKVEKTIVELEGNVVYYKYLGYSSVPKFLLGTTVDGKDIIKLSFRGLRTSLLISIIASAICFAFGLCWGAVSGYFGGNVDLAMERFCEILGGVPWIVVMTLTILLLGNNIVTFGLALCLTGWLSPAARTRTQFYRFKGREYVLASRTLGASDRRLIFHHILPNSLGTIVTGSVLMIPSTIFSEATLSYLNLGLQGVDSFGVILSKNQQFIGSYPALIVFPAIIISLLMISFNLFGNGLRDALNPSLKGSE